MGAYQLNASAYITKPVDFDQFIAAIQEIDSFRVKIVHQPAKT
jgi:two-component system response regulator